MTNTNVTVATFDKLKIEYDKSHKNDNEVSCFFAGSYNCWQDRKIAIQEEW